MRIESTTSIFPATDEPVEPKGGSQDGCGAFAAVMDQLGTATVKVPAGSSDIAVSQDPAVREAGPDLAGTCPRPAPMDPASTTSRRYPSACEGDSEDAPADQPDAPSTTAKTDRVGFPVVQVKWAADALPDSPAAQTAASLWDCTVIRASALADNEAVTAAEALNSQALTAGRGHQTGESAPTADTVVGDGVAPVVEADKPVRAVRISGQGAPWRRVPNGGEMNVAGVPGSGGPVREGDQGRITAGISGGEVAGPDVPGDRPANEVVFPSLRAAVNEGRRGDGGRSATSTGDAVSASRPGFIEKPGTPGTSAAGVQESAAPRSTPSHASGYQPADGEAVSISSGVSAQGAPIGGRPKPDSDGIRTRIVSNAPASDPSVRSLVAHKAADMPASMPSPSTDAALLRSEFLFEVAERIAIAARGSTHEVTIQLRPDHLGRISLTAQSGADGLIARITTESASLRQFLESNLPALQESLQEYGLKVHHIDVLTQQRSDLHNPGSLGQQRSGHAHQEQDGSGQRGIHETAPAQGSSATGELLVDPWTLAALYPRSTFHTVA